MAAPSRVATDTSHRSDNATRQVCMHNKISILILIVIMVCGNYVGTYMG